MKEPEQLVQLYFSSSNRNQIVIELLWGLNERGFVKNSLGIGVSPP